VSEASEGGGRAVRRRGFGVVGLGAAACAACCVGPILGVLGGIGALSLGAGSTLGLLAGVLVLTVGVVGFVVWRRRRNPSCAAPLPQQVPVGAPVRR
jgi:hypothetical protein